MTSMTNSNKRLIDKDRLLPREDKEAVEETGGNRVIGAKGSKIGR